MNKLILSLMVTMSLFFFSVSNIQAKPYSTQEKEIKTIKRLAIATVVILGVGTGATILYTVDKNLDPRPSEKLRKAFFEK